MENEKSVVVCYHCRGTGREPTVLEIFDGLTLALRNLGWTHAQIERLKNEVKPEEALGGVPQCNGLDLLAPDGTIRTIERCPEEAR